MDLEQLKKDTGLILCDVLDKANLRQGQILVLGLSSSEVAGGQIGKASSIEIGEVIVKTLLDELTSREIFLAVQGCEHLNRALVVERELADKKELEIVNVLPSLHAGLDIGDTSVGMHVKHVQVPIRPILRELGGAHVTALASRPKLIGGSRARYQEDPIRKA